MINLLYLDDNNNIIEELENINVEKDYKLDKLYFVVVNNNLQSQLICLQSLTNTFDFQMTYNLNHSDYSADTIYTTSESNISLIQSRLIELINAMSKDKIGNIFQELKDDSVLSVFLEKRKLVIEKKEKLAKKISEYKTLLEILNNVQSLINPFEDLNLIK
jgi:hypothetical protein